MLYHSIHPNVGVLTTGAKDKIISEPDCLDMISPRVTFSSLGSIDNERVKVLVYRLRNQVPKPRP